ncbi:MAG: DMT family transporter [Pseudomonadota bacterium]
MSDARRSAGTLMRGPILVLAGGICIGFAPIGLRLGLDELGPQAIAFWRYGFAVPVLYALAVILQRRQPARPNRFVIIAGTCFALDIALWHWGLERTTVANATFIVNLGNISVGLLAWAVLGERPSLAWAAAFTAALAGAGLLSLGGGQSGQGDLVGDLLSLGAAVMVSGYVLASALSRRTLSGIDAIFWLTVVELCVGGMVLLVSGEPLLPVSAGGFAAPLFLALVVQVGGQGLILTGLGHTPPAMAGVLVLVQPVAAALISWQLFGEVLTTLQVFGAGLILTGVYIAQRRARPSEAVSEPERS